MNDEFVESLRDLFHLLATAFVNHIQDVKFQAEEGHSGYYVTARVNRADQRKIIGTRAKNVKAIRSILRAHLEQNGRKLDDLKILEPTFGQDMDVFDEFVDKDWTHTKSESMAKFVRDVIRYFDRKVDVEFSDSAHGQTRIKITPSYEYGPIVSSSLESIFKANAKVKGRSIILEFGDAPESL